MSRGSGAIVEQDRQNEMRTCEKGGRGAMAEQDGRDEWRKGSNSGAGLAE